jgi:hypothetical protein
MQAGFRALAPLQLCHGRKRSASEPLFVGELALKRARHAPCHVNEADGHLNAEAGAARRAKLTARGNENDRCHTIPYL